MEEKKHFDSEKLVEVAAVYNDIEANIIKSLLESAGIDCVLVTQVPHSVYPITLDGLGEVKIKVLDIHEEAAKQVIRDYEEAGPLEEESNV